MKISTESIKQYIYDHPRINLVQYIIRKKLPYADACRDIIDKERNPFVVQYRHYGSKNYRNPIYHISIGDEYKIMGFCSLLRVTLLHLAYANRMGFTPIVSWEKCLLYSEQDIFNGTQNSFEYFFENTSHISINEIYESDLVVHAKKYDTQMYVEKLSYFVQESELEILADTIKANLRFNILGIEEIDKPCSILLKRGKVLGVHVRGTDFRNEFSRHPVMVTLDEYCDTVKKIFDSGCYDYIFLATDEEKTINKFQDLFDDKLLYFDSLRSKDGTPLHYGNRSERQNNSYLLGKEILRDVYMLGNCDGLVAGLSNITIIARAIKRSMEKQYIDLKVVDKGLHFNMRESYLYIKR